MLFQFTRFEAYVPFDGIGGGRLCIANEKWFSFRRYIIIVLDARTVTMLPYFQSFMVRHAVSIRSP